MRYARLAGPYSTVWCKRCLGKEGFAVEQWERPSLDWLPLRVVSHYRELRGILAGEMPWPRFAIVYPVRGCNLSCVYCEYLELNRGATECADFGALMPTLLELRNRGLEAVEFCGGGEPTLHPELPRVATQLRQEGLFVGLLTNGVGLRQAELPLWMETLSYLRVSLDAASPETFATLKRCPRKIFDELVGKLTECVSLRERGGFSCEIGIKMCVTEVNRHEVAKLAELARKLRVDSLQFKAARNCPSSMDDRSLAAVEHTIAGLRTAEGGPRILGGLRKSTIEARCVLTPLNIVIDADGSAYLCCYFSHRQERHRIGNVFHEDIRDIWNGPRHREAIQSITPEECSVYDCRFHAYNKLVQNTIVNGNGFWSFL